MKKTVVRDVHEESERTDVRTRELAGEHHPLSVYLKQISFYPLLSKEEELAIGERIKEPRTPLLLSMQRFIKAGLGRTGTYKSDVSMRQS